MNIIEAIKSGKPFKRRCKTYDYWYAANSVHQQALYDEDILADDWEIQEPREFWLVGGYYFNKEESAVDHLNNIDGPMTKIIHVREILE